MEDANAVKLLVGAAGLIIALIILAAIFPVVVIGAGERGVVFNNTSGIENRILGEGMHFRIPFVQTVHSMSIKVQKTDITAPAASKDMQTVNTKIVLNWHLDEKSVNKIYQNIGDEKTIIDRIIIPNTNEVVKAATAQYTAEELLTKRPALKENIDLGLTARLQTYNVILDDVSIVDIDFSDEFNKAIEAKATAEQNALAEKNKLETVKYQAQQQVETAKAQAETIRIQAEAINKQGGADYVNLQWIEAWKSGGAKVPQIINSGNSSGFLYNMGDLK